MLTKAWHKFVEYGREGFPEAFLGKEGDYGAGDENGAESDGQEDSVVMH